MNQMQIRNGAAASPGIGVGPAYVVSSGAPTIPDVAEPASAFAAAAEAASAQLNHLADAAEASGLKEAAEILRAQALMAEDPMLADEVEQRLQQGDSLADALAGASVALAEALQNTGVEYLAQRAADVAEVVNRIAHTIAGVTPAGLGDIGEPSVVVARVLTAADTAAMNPALVRGFVTEEGGPTGHVAVIAKALGIPAVVGVAQALASVENGDGVIVDGIAGTVIVRPDAATTTEYAERAARRQVLVAAAQSYRGWSISFGDRAMTVAANVGSPGDVAAAAEEKADGIGLYRTEFLFLDTAEAPSEDSQLVAYGEALTAFEHPVVIRTFDIGGDKPAEFVAVAPEENPFLGVRGMRLYAQERHLALTQARALLRAAMHGELWVMAPMIATVTDARWMRELYDAARESLDAEGVEYGVVKLGAMVEVPAAALNAAALARHVDFFSIGTNDLTQYTLAADRTSGVLASYADAADPAVLRLCAMTATAGGEHGLSVSVCGEAAADPALAVLYAAMGMDKLSVNPNSVNLIKKSLDEFDAGTAADLLQLTLRAASASEVRGLLTEAGL